MFDIKNKFTLKPTLGAYALGHGDMLEPALDFISPPQISGVFSIHAPLVKSSITAPVVGYARPSTVRFTSTSITKSVTAPASNVIGIRVAEQAYAGDAKFEVFVDYKRVGPVYISHADYNTGKSETFVLPGKFGPGPHVVDVSFINDMYGGPGLDRNLFVTGYSYNGVMKNVDIALTNQDKTATFSVTDGKHDVKIAPVSHWAGFKFLGVNLAGAEFGVPAQEWGGVNIGTYGTDYTFPTHGELDYYAKQNMNTIRLPFSWERVQPTMNGALNQTYLGRIDDVVHYAYARGITVVLDPHNYGYGYGNLVGTPGTPSQSFADLWSKLASHYVRDKNVLFGLMNEPHEQSPSEWVAPVNAAIAAIRTTGSKQEILVPGTHYTGGDSWLTSGNADIFAANVVDPLHNMAFEIHQYSDADQSGSSASVVSPTIGAERLAGVTNWAEKTGNHLFLGEFGSGSDAASLANLRNMLDFMKVHSGVWQGGTEWGGGPWWGNGYPLSTESSLPATAASMPTVQLQVLHSYMPHLLTPIQ